MSQQRKAAISMNGAEFKSAGHLLIDKISIFLDTIQQKPVTTGESPRQLQKLLQSIPFPVTGKSAEALLIDAADKLFDHSLFNGHPKFHGYITSSAAPIGVLGDLLASAVNANVGAQVLSPMATEIEKQTISWLAEFIGLPPGYGGIMVSGGNMANFTGFMAGITAKAPKTIKEEGISTEGGRLFIYCSIATHTWIDKAAVLFGLGKKSVKWIKTDAQGRMDIQLLEQTIINDLEDGGKPIMIIGTAGDVSTGVVDDMKSLAIVSHRYNLWFHIDGAYGICAAVVPSLKQLFEGIEEADSIALDPHKWLYSPLEAGCTLVKDPNHLMETYSSHPVYYNFDSHDNDVTHNFYEYGFQNSRGFRALKVWLALQQAGSSGYISMIEEDIRLSKLLFELAETHPELKAITQHLSITTMQFVPKEFQYPDVTTDVSRNDTTDVTRDDTDAAMKDPIMNIETLNELNKTLLNELQHNGEVFLSNAVVEGKYCLRSCIVNFRTSEQDIIEIIDIIVKTGNKIYNSNYSAHPHELK
jgi:aromatic-L-amino-acid decarboxylase